MYQLVACYGAVVPKAPANGIEKKIMMKLACVMVVLAGRFLPCSNQIELSLSPPQNGSPIHGPQEPSGV